jgi:uncharacterized protein YbjT (DUF2867 family)
LISTLGITRLKDGLRYIDVDYQANLNLLKEAKQAGVTKFIYISALGAPEHQQVRLLQAKEKFAQELLVSTELTPCVIRPNGFYCDIEEVYKMAKSGRAYLFGDGQVKLNPIHGEDLAQFCLEAINKEERELDVGGPEMLTNNAIVKLAFDVQNKPQKLIYLPDWVRKLALFICRKLPERITGPAEFFLTVCSHDLIAPTYGKYRLRAHFQALFEKAN